MKFAYVAVTLYYVHISVPVGVKCLKFVTLMFYVSYVFGNACHHAFV